MKKRIIIIIISLVIIIAAGLWYFVFRQKDKPIILQTIRPSYGYISEIVTATGAIEPVDTVAVGSQVSGTIKYLYVDFNTTVKEGQLIAALDKTLLQAQADQFSANLQVAKSQLVYEKSNYDRQTLLFNTGAISKADDETALYQYNSAKNNVNSVLSQLQGAQKNLSLANIYSPINGTVLNRNISVGQTIAASFNTPTLFIIANDLTKMQVEAAVDEADIGNVKKGLRASFTVDAFAKDVFNGTVEEVRLQPTVSANVVTYVTIVNTPNDDLKLKPGMTANINIYTKEDPNALLIPVKALKYTPDASLQKNYIIQFDTTIINVAVLPIKPKTNLKDTSIKKTVAVLQGTLAFVWVKSGKTLTQRKISIGINDDINVQVLSGLTVDDDVVTGIATATDPKRAASAERSPFMPKMGAKKTK